MKFIFLLTLIFMAGSSSARENRLSRTWTVIVDRKIGYQFEVPVLPQRLIESADYPVTNSNVVVRLDNGFIRRVQNYIPSEDHWLGLNEFMLEISTFDKSRFDLKKMRKECLKEPAKLPGISGGQVCKVNEDLLQGDGCTTHIATFTKSDKFIQMFLCGSALSAKDRSRIFNSIAPSRGN